jgi:ABC-type bacteriocin/lantibiotic exporter with double-glycine peptidase domain
LPPFFSKPDGGDAGKPKKLKTFCSFSKKKTSSTALYRGWDVTLVLMSVTPLMALANAVSAPAIRRAAAARARADALPSAAAAEALQGVRTVYVSGTQRQTVEAVSALCELSVGPGTALGWLRGLSQGATSALFLAG